VSRPSNEMTATAVAGMADPVPAPARARRRPRRLRFGHYLRTRIGAGQLVVELFQGRSRPRLLGSLAREYTDPDSGERVLPTELAQAIAGLTPALASIQEKLEADGTGSLQGLPCEVVVDDSWMLYDVVRADLRGLSPRAADALIGASLADVAGLSPSELASRWQPQGRSAFTLACGLPANALPALREALAAFGIQAESIEGEFVHEFNRYRERLAPRCAVIALVRDAGAQLAIVIDGVLTAMSFEFGVGAARELELRGRSLLRAAGLGGDGAIHFYALAPAGWATSEPWVCLPLAA